MKKKLTLLAGVVAICSMCVTGFSVADNPSDSASQARCSQAGPDGGGGTTTGC